MKRTQKSKEALLALFEREGYKKFGDSFAKGNAYFHYEMFMDCEKELNVSESKNHSEYEFESSEYYIKEEWLEPIEEPMKVMVLCERSIRNKMRFNHGAGIDDELLKFCGKEICVKPCGNGYKQQDDGNVYYWLAEHFVPISLRRAEEVQQ